MTRKEREELNELSLQLYGKKYHWQKMMKQGEYREETVLSKKSGNAMKVKRLTYLSLEDVVDRMNDQVKNNKEAAAKAAEEAVKNAEGEVSGTEEVQTQEA